MGHKCTYKTHVHHIMKGYIYIYINKYRTCERFIYVRTSTLLIRFNFPVSQNGFVGEHSIKIINKLFRPYTCDALYIII